MAGRTFVAQSSSLKNSTVAPNASNPALRACTNGSRRERVKAATRTLVLDYTFVSNLLSDVAESTYTLAQVLRDPSQANSRVGPDTGLIIIGRPCQKSQQLPVDRPVTQLSNDRENSLNSLLTNNRSDIREAGSLELAVSTVVTHEHQKIEVASTHHLREDLVIDDLLRKRVDHQRQIIQQANP